MVLGFKVPAVCVCARAHVCLWGDGSCRTPGCSGTLDCSRSFYCSGTFECSSTLHSFLTRSISWYSSEESLLMTAVVFLHMLLFCFPVAKYG